MKKVSKSKAPLPRKVKKMSNDKSHVPHIKRVVEEPKLVEVKEVKKPSTVSIRNNTEMTYNLTSYLYPILLKPGLNSGFERKLAESIVKDLNKAVPGDNNNPFTVE